MDRGLEPDLVVLEGLGSINWSSLGHAFGPAHDVPKLLRELANADASIRDEAAAELCSNIYHQGSVYEATSAAVPFLSELARADLPDPGPVLMVLLAVAEGADGQRRMTAVGRRIADAKFDPVRAKQHGEWAERVLQALRDECDALIGHDSRDWRYLATVVMVVSVACPEQCDRQLREVRARAAREDQPTAPPRVGSGMLRAG